MNKAVTFGLLCVVIISLVPSDAQKCSIKKKQLTKKVCQLNGIVSGLKGALEEHVKKAEADATSRRNEIDTLVNNLTAVVNALEEKETDTTSRLNKIETLLNDLTETVNALEEKDTSCPSGFITHGSSCYMFSNETQTWTDAKIICISMGAYLVEITSKEEDDFLFSKVTGKDQIFIGANDIAQEGQFVWDHSGTKLGFTNWYPGEPNDVNGEHCASLYDIGQWNDLPCDRKSFFICEKK